MRHSPTNHFLDFLDIVYAVFIVVLFVVGCMAIVFSWSYFIAFAFKFVPAS